MENPRPYYDPYAKCPKCGGTDVTTHYYKNAHDCYGRDHEVAPLGSRHMTPEAAAQEWNCCTDEHFDRTCRRCHFVWAERPIPTADPALRWTLHLTDYERVNLLALLMMAMWEPDLNAFNTGDWNGQLLWKLGVENADIRAYQENKAVSAKDMPDDVKPNSAPWEQLKYLIDHIRRSEP